MAASLALATALLAAAATSQAAIQVKARSASVAVPENGNGEVAASCRKGRRALSGGFAAPFDPTATGGNPQILPFENVRPGVRRWSVGAHEFGLGEGTLTAFVYCAHSPRIVRRASAPVTLAENERGPATATCPPGLKAISGGYASADTKAGNAALVALASRRIGKRSWRVDFFNDGGTGKGRAFVYCRAGKAPQAVTSAIPLQNNTSGSVTPLCPRGKVSVAGGFTNLGVDSTSLIVANVSRKLGGRGWRVVAGNAGAAPGTLRAFAYCL